MPVPPVLSDVTSFLTDAEDGPMTEEEDAMRKLMGFSNFDTTKVCSQNYHTTYALGSLLGIYLEYFSNVT